MGLEKLKAAHHQKARSLLFTGRKGFYRKSAFDSLVAHMPTPFVPPQKWPDRVTLAVRCASRDEWNMLTVIDRLEWMRKLAVRTKFLKERWGEYAASDIEHWFVDFRSLLDHIASAVKELASKPGQTSDSFQCLYAGSTGAKDQRFERTLGPEWVSLIQSADWFPHLRNIRGAIVHFGAQAMVFGPPSDGILFQITAKSHDYLIHWPEFMFNNNVVYFEKYAAHFMSHLVVFLDEFAAIAGRRLGIHLGRRPQNFHPGFGILMKWITSTTRSLGRSPRTALFCPRDSTRDRSRMVGENSNRLCLKPDWPLLDFMQEV